MTDQLLRFTDSTELANRAAGMLVTQIAEYQQDPDRIVHLCLTGGRIAQRVYESFGGRLEAAGADGPPRVIKVLRADAASASRVPIVSAKW